MVGGGGGQVMFYPYERVGRGEKVLVMLKGGGGGGSCKVLG